MKRLAPTIFILLMVMSFVYADIQAPEPTPKPVYINKHHQGNIRESPQNVPYHYISHDPVQIMTSYFDYMIGSYNGLPLYVVPEEFGGGYFMVYHGRRDLDSPRRIFYTYLFDLPSIYINNEITQVPDDEIPASEGYPGLAFDPVLGKPLYAWHANADDDPELEVHFVADLFHSGFSGLFENYQVIVDNPVQITAPNGTITSNNHFLWPEVVTGPSPESGKRRIYVSTRNSVSHAVNNGACGNVLLAYSDIDESMMLNGVAPTWNFTSVPTYDLWNVDATNWRRPFSTLCADEAGNIYYIGYHTAYDAENQPIDEPDIHVMKCDNYGEGTWTVHTASGHIPVWIPDPPPWFDPHADHPLFPPGESYWAIHNSSHTDAVVDNVGRIHFPALWGFTTEDGTYFPNMQYLKQIVFDTNRNEFSIHDVYPVKHFHNTASYEHYHPWDTEPPWGEAEYIWIDGECYLDVETIWPFCHWDGQAHDGSMMFHYNNLRMSKPNCRGMTAMVWQDSKRALLHSQADDPGQPGDGFAPDIMIAVSVDGGLTWKEPLRLNGEDYPQLAGITPMWVYPADQVTYAGIENGWHMGKIGLMFYDDYTWGANAIPPSYHDNNDGGCIMFMEVKCAFWPADDSDDPMADAPALNLLRGNYPNPFNPTTTISYNLPASGKVKLGVYNLRGQLVRTLVNEAKSAGDHKVVWDGKDERGNTMSSGIYFYRLDTGKHSETRKMMLMK